MSYVSGIRGRSPETYPQSPAAGAGPSSSGLTNAAVVVGSTEDPPTVAIVANTYVPVDDRDGPAFLTTPANPADRVEFEVADLYNAFGTGPVTVTVVGAGITIYNPSAADPSAPYGTSATFTTPGTYLYRFLASTSQWVPA